MAQSFCLSLSLPLFLQNLFHKSIRGGRFVLCVRWIIIQIRFVFVALFEISMLMLRLHVAKDEFRFGISQIFTRKLRVLTLKHIHKRIQNTVEFEFEFDGNNACK